MIKVIIDNQPVEYWNAKDMSIDLLHQTMGNCEYRSIENIKENITKMIDLLILQEDILSDKRFCKKLTNSLVWIKRTRNKEDAIDSIFNLILSIEGLGNLTGFGVKNKYEDANIFARIS